MSQRIQKSPYWIEKIFDRAASGIKKTHVDALLLSLASANLLEIQRIHNEDRWNIARTKHPYNADAGKPVYFSLDAWRGINLYSEGRARKRNAQLVAQVAKDTLDDDENKSEESSDDDTDVSEEIVND